MGANLIAFNIFFFMDRCVEFNLVELLQKNNHEVNDKFIILAYLKEFTSHVTKPLATSVDTVETFFSQTALLWCY